MGLSSHHFAQGKVKFTENEMGQAVGNMFPIIVAARLLAGLLPKADSATFDLTAALWATWVTLESTSGQQEIMPGLPWLPPQALACSLRARLNASATSGGGQVQSWMRDDREALPR